MDILDFVRSLIFKSTLESLSTESNVQFCSLFPPKQLKYFHNFPWSLRALADGCLHYTKLDGHFIFSVFSELYFLKFMILFFFNLHLSKAN